MPRARAIVSQTEIERCAKAMRAAGVEEFRVEIEKPDGTKVSVIAGKGSDAATAADEIDAMIGRLP